MHCTHTAGSVNVKVQNLFHGLNNITCSTIRKYRTATTLCTLETWCVFMYITVNTLHTGGNKDNNNYNNKNIVFIIDLLLSSKFTTYDVWLLNNENALSYRDLDHFSQLEIFTIYL